MKRPLIQFLKNLPVVVLLVLILAGCKDFNSSQDELKMKTFGELHYNAPLDAVKWTGGFWNGYMQKLRDVYLPGTLDGSFLDLGNGSSLRNFHRAAGMEEGGALGRRWSDGDCYYLMDVASRMYAYKPDEYLKSKLDYWIPVFAQIQHNDGVLDTWTDLKEFEKGSEETWAKYERRFNTPPLHGYLNYNIHHLYASAFTNYRIDGDKKFLDIADKAIQHFINEAEKPDSLRQRDYDADGHFAIACGLKYSLTGDERYLNFIKSIYDTKSSLFGPPLKDAQEIFGHNTHAAEYLTGAIALYRYTGDTMVIEALKRLADNMLSSKIYITGAVAPVYKNEAIGEAYDLPNENAYCESCGQSMFMEWFYRMFLLTGEARYMDASEQILYNSLVGCVDIDRPNFFYANPQEQLSWSDRKPEGQPETRWNRDHYTWTRTFAKHCACCPPKVLRGLALTNEIAYSTNEEGVWVNLYGTNTYSTRLPSGASLVCEQSANYPWDGKIRLVFKETKSKKPYSLFMRIPGWLNSPVNINVNGEQVAENLKGGSYYKITRNWTKGDVVETEFPMPVKIMVADPRIKDNLGKVAVMRGPVVYCLEDQDITDGVKIDSVFFSAATDLQPYSTLELGGVTKLLGNLFYSKGKSVVPDSTSCFNPDGNLYQEVKLKEGFEARGDLKSVKVSMIPFYARLNREGRYFKVWIPMYLNN